MFFLGKCVRSATKTMAVDRKKAEGISSSSAIFGIGTAAKYCELKRYAHGVDAAELKKEKVLEDKLQFAA